MSFQSVEVAVEGPKSKPVRQWQDNKSEFERDIMDNVQQMQESARRADDALQTASRNSLSKTMEVSIERELNMCKRFEEQTEQIFRDWTVHMAGEPLERHRKRFACDKLRKAFDEEVASLRHLERRAHSTRHMSAKHAEYDEEVGLHEPLGSDSSTTNLTTVAINDSLMDRHEDLKMESELAFQREEGIKRIQTQMASVNQIFRDLASIVTEQGRHIETIEQNAEESGDNSKRAMDELQKAYKRQDSTAHLWFFILAVTLFVCITILMHMSAASPAPTTGSVVNGDGRSVGIADASTTSDFATGFGTRVMANGKSLI